MVQLFQSSDPDEARGAVLTVKEALDRGAAQIAREFEEQPLVRARLPDTIGSVYVFLGAGRPATLATLENLASRYEQAGQAEQTLPLLREQLEQMAPDNPARQALEQRLQALAESGS